VRAKIILIVTRVREGTSESQYHTY